VLDAALRQSYAWHADGADWPLAVNLCVRDLRDPKLLGRIKGSLATWGANPDWIQFELTESSIMEDPTAALKTLGQMKDLGVRLLIDDFGTGYSSLAYLQKLPVDTIKIDQSFVTKMSTDRGSATIVRSAIDLGHDLNLEVIAEGVESEELLTQVADLGCDAAQGFAVGRPVPAEQFEQWEAGSRWHAAQNV
jgi:diguanylate cyclase